MKPALKTGMGLRGREPLLQYGSVATAMMVTVRVAAITVVFTTKANPTEDAADPAATSPEPTIAP
jgi:hypothetical protein